MYRTGDICKWTEDGEIQVIGRMDDMVKVKGYRIELDEVSLAISKHPEVTESVVVVKDDMLVGFVTPSNVDTNDIREFISETLPHYMIPATIVTMDAFPMNHNGKIDKSCLKQIEINNDFIPPSTELEIQMAEIWSEILKVSLLKIGRYTSFFELGGDSISAIQLITLCKKRGFELTASEIFKHSRLIQMASIRHQLVNKVLMKKIVVSHAILDEIKLQVANELTHYDIYPSTPLQNGLVALSMKNNSSYLNQMKLQFKEQLDLKRLEFAFSILTSIHDSLRTQFVSTSERIYSIVHPVLNITVERFTDLQDYCAKDLQKGFQVGDKQWFRCGLQEDGLMLVLSIHHVLYDGWSLRKLLNDLFDCYNGVSIAKPISFKNVVTFIESQDKEAIKQYWARYLKGVEVDSGLFSNQLISQPKSSSSPLKQTINVDMKQLKLAASKSKVTLASLTKASWALTLKSYTQKNTIVFGHVVSGRDLPVEGIEKVIGMLINTIPFRVDIKSTQTLQEFLDQIQQHQIDCLPYAQTSLIDIQKWAGIQGQDKLFSTNFVFENLPERDNDSERGYKILENDDFTKATFNSNDMTIALFPTAESLTFSIDYDLTKIVKDEASRIASHFNYIVSKMTKLITDGQLKTSIDSLATLDSTEIQQLLAFGTGAKAYIKYEAAHDAFEECAKKEPHLIAVEHENRSITYGQLNERAEEIAQILIDHGVKVGDYIGLVTFRSIEMICGIFGILKAGGAYIPIDHELPVERIQYMLNQAQCSTVLYHPDIHQEVLDILGPASISLNELSMSITKSLPKIPIDGPAYVVFTSGSTGKPKGVMIKHRSCTNVIEHIQNMIEPKTNDRISQSASIGFDVAVSEIFLALSSKSTLVLRESGDYFANLKNVNIAFLTPTGLSKLDPLLYPKLEKIFVAGERCTESLISKWVNAQIINAYGPTETTQGSSFGFLYANSQINIGKPVQNTVQYILNKDLQLVPIGVQGELVIGGVGVALGYLNQPELTTEKFINNHFTNDGTKMYRTGDICKWTEDGKIQILGRMDDMVKVKGYRIELDEVSAAISRHPEVTGSDVIVKDDQLVAFITPETVNVDSIRDFITEILPSFMLPHLFVTLKEFPINTNGKIDKKALNQFEIKSNFQPPSTDLEIKIAKIWSQVLKVPLNKIGRYTSFFELGGDSISAIQLMTFCREASLDISTSSIFKRPTLKAMVDILLDVEIPKSMENEVVVDDRLIVVCLHGQAQNKFICEHQMTQIINTCRNDIQFVFLEGDITSKNYAYSIDSNLTGMKHFDWWSNDQNDAVDKCIQVYKQLEVFERVDAIFGFSQGATLVELLDRLAALGRVRKLWKVSILASGVPLTIPSIDCSKQLPELSLHFSGKLEVNRIGNTMLQRYQREYRKNIQHEFGHEIPKDPYFATYFHDALLATYGLVDKIKEKSENVHLLYPSLPRVRIVVLYSAKLANYKSFFSNLLDEFDKIRYVVSLLFVKIKTPTTFQKFIRNDHKDINNLLQDLESIGPIDVLLGLPGTSFFFQKLQNLNKKLKFWSLDIELAASSNIIGAYDINDDKSLIKLLDRIKEIV
ncbi:hypothetical protein HDV02_003076 [Globomyces sp. JEL0801]|nr:hypothetical protein HDV02_003076 [Globomyces sp. JEL0801]